MKKNNQQQIDAIAEKWVNLVLAHVRAKKLNKKTLKRNGTKK